MGEAWKAFDSLRDELVVIKKIVLDDETSRLRFSREGEVLQRLDHENIVRVLESNIVDDTPFLVMELVEGASVATLLRIAQGRLPRSIAIKIMIQVASGLAYVHAAGIIHRDVSSQNVMVTKSGVAKLIDFGIAKTDQGPDLTAPGQVLGKPGYMAPEQYLGDAIDARIDVFGAGVVFYELLSGKRPYGRTRGREDEVMQAVMAGRFPSLASRGITGPLPQLIERAMHPDRTVRPNDGAALLAALRAAESAPSEEDGEATIRALHAIAPSALTASDAEHKRLREVARSDRSLRSERPTDPGGTPPKKRARSMYRSKSRASSRARSIVTAALVGAAVAVAFLVGRSTGFDAGRRAQTRAEWAAAPPSPPAVVAAPPPTAIPEPAPSPEPSIEPPAAEPNDANRLFAQARSSLLLGRLVDAEVQLQRCLEIDPNYAECHRNLAVLRAKQDDTTRAVHHYRRYLELAPDAADAERVRAMLRDVEAP